MTLAKRAGLFFFLAAAAFYLYGLGHLPLVGPDEPRYAEVAREMYLRGDLVTPTLGGHTWFEKPALLYWMMMASYRAFGISEWAARLGPALSGLITALLIYWMGRRIERAAEPEKGMGAGLGLWSGAATAASAGMIVFSRAASFDVIVTMTVTAALACFFVAEIEVNEKRRRFCLAGFYVAIGASVLAKGLVGIVIPGVIVGLYYLLRREWPRWRSLGWSALWGLPLVLAVAATWYAPVIAQHGWTFVDEFFIQHHFARFVSDKYHHPQGFYFYVPIILMLALPWTALLIKALADTRRWNWRERTVESKARIFALAWMVAPVIFFSISKSKLPGYILPALPGAMLLVGERLARFVQNDESSGAMRVTGGILLVLALAGIVYATRTGDITLSCSLAIGAPLLIAGALLLFRLGQSRALHVELICSAMFISVALILNCGVARLNQRESVRDLMQLAAGRGYTATPVFYMLTDDRTGEFYAGGRLVYKTDGEPFRFDDASEAARAARPLGGTALVFVPTKWENQLTGYPAIETEIIGSNGVLTLAVMRVR
jgi:4-amino-4-deoxy-L-arabinose transferase-like glycosyltransferase